MNAEKRGVRIRIAEGVTSDEVRDAASALGNRLVRRYSAARRRDVTVETIDGHRSAGSKWVAVFLEAGYRSAGTGLRFYAGL